MKRKILIIFLLLGSLINASDLSLVEAVRQNNVDEVIRLLKSGVLVDIIDSEYELTALMMAALTRNNNICKILLNAGAKVNMTDNSEGKVTALMYATSLKGGEAVVQTLLNAGALINMSNYKGLTALMGASIQNDDIVVKILLMSGADPNLKNIEGKTALDFAQDSSTKELLKTYQNIQCREINEDASPLTFIEYISQKEKELGSKYDEMTDSEYDLLLESAKKNEVDYLYKLFVPAYEKYVLKDSVTPLIRFFCNVVFLKSGLLRILEFEIFRSTKLLLGCLIALSKVASSNDKNKIAKLIEQVETTMKMSNDKWAQQNKLAKLADTSYERKEEIKKWESMTDGSLLE